MNALVEGVAGNAIWNGITAGARSLLGRQIQITSPRPMEALTDRQPLGQMWQFPVRGTLKRLPGDHEIWLLNQDEKTGLLRPQGFSIVKYDPDQGIWHGMVCSNEHVSLRIIAVVAPPTSCDFFRYFQHIGQQRDYTFEPLKRIPPECRNMASVQTNVP
jgi:hypothetical protein